MKLAIRCDVNYQTNVTLLFLSYELLLRNGSWLLIMPVLPEPLGSLTIYSGYSRCELCSVMRWGYSEPLIIRCRTSTRTGCQPSSFGLKLPQLVFGGRARTKSPCWYPECCWDCVCWKCG